MSEAAEASGLRARIILDLMQPLAVCSSIALALAVGILLAGALALRWLAAGQPAWIRISPERLADTARRAGMAGFAAISAAAFALVWSVLPTIFHHLHHGALDRALPAAYNFPRCGRPGGLVCLWAWLLAPTVSFYG